MEVLTTTEVHLRFDELTHRINNGAIFIYPTDTFKIETFHPDSVVNGHCFSQYFPNATHASFLRTPLNNLSDSIYLYYISNKLRNNCYCNIFGVGRMFPV